MKLHLVYGSETGTAEGLIRLLNNVLSRLNKTLTTPVEVELFSCDQFIPKLVEKEDMLVIMIVSTTWDGDPPENSFKFRNKVLELESLGNEKALSHINFALLGLGDRGYENFGKFPRFVYENFVKLGASPKFPFEIADDEEGAYLTIEPWMDDIIPFVKSWNTGIIPDNIYTDLKTIFNPFDTQNPQITNNQSKMIDLPVTPERVSLDFSNKSLSKSFEKGLDLESNELKSWLFDKFKFLWVGQ